MFSGRWFSRGQAHVPLCGHRRGYVHQQVLVVEPVSVGCTHMLGSQPCVAAGVTLFCSLLVDRKIKYSVEASDMVGAEAKEANEEDG